MKYREVSRAIIHDAEYRILLARRATGKDKDRWALVGGKPEGGESPAQTIIREVKEEIGLDFEPVLFREEIDESWRVSYFSGPALGVLALDATENSEAQYFPADELTSLDIALGHERIIEEFLAGVRA